MNMLAFALGSMIAALAGAMLVQAFSWLPQAGAIPAMRSYVIVVLGGLGSLPGAVLIGFFALFPFVYSANDYPYIMHILITAFFYAILTSSWSMLSGYGGQFSFGHMGFMGIGAYTAALFSNYFYLAPLPTGLCTEVQIGGTWLIILDPIGVTSSTLVQNCLTQAQAVWDASVEVTRMSPWLGILLGSPVGGLFGLLIGLLVLPLRAAYLALFTLGFSEILRAVISAEISVTRGQAGLELPPLFADGITIFGRHYDANDKVPPYFAMFFLLLLCLGILGWLAKSKFGLFVRAACAKIRTRPRRLASTSPATRFWSWSSPR